MRLLTDLSLFWTLPLGLILVSWVGAKLGARATFMLLPPFSVMLIHTGNYVSADLSVAAKAAALSMKSVPMVFAWAIPYFHISRRLDGRLSSRHEEVVASFVAATVAAFLIQAAYHPWWTPLTTRPDAQLAGVIAVLIFAAWFVRLRSDERKPVSAVPTPNALFGRIAIVLVMVSTLFATRSLPAQAALVLLVVLGTVPRMTFEMAVSTHLTNGVTASRQVLAGLPIGVTVVVIWCTALMQLPSRLPGWTVVPTAFLLTVTWSAVLVVGYLRIFGVYRAENGFFEAARDRVAPASRLATEMHSEDDVNNGQRDPDAIG